MLMTLANLFIVLVLRSLSLPLSGFYCLLSVAEHLILESSNKEISKDWNIFELTEMTFLEEQPELTIGDEEANIAQAKKTR